jgi:hypothetical protein
MQFSIKSCPDTKPEPPALLSGERSKLILRAEADVIAARTGKIHA